MAGAQNPNRHIRFRSIGRDSLNLALDDGYFLIEDSCKQITRYCRFDFKQRKFQGKFTDVSNVTPGLIVAEGVYTMDGLKEGPFITHYLNGKLQAKGIIFNTPDPAPFHDALGKAGYYERWRKTFGEEGWTLLEQYAGKLA